MTSRDQLRTEVDRLRTEVRQIKTVQLRADVVTLQADVAGLDHGDDLAGLLDDDHTNLLNSARHASEDHSGLGGEIVYAENAEAGVSVASTSDITIATTDVTGVVSGDLLIATSWIRIFNDSGGTRTYTMTTEMGSVIQDTAVSIIGNDHGVFRHEWTLAVVSTSDAQFQAQIEFDLNSVANTYAAATHRNVHRTSASDLTGTVTVAFKVRSSTATATQTAYNHGFIVRKISST